MMGAETMQRGGALYVDFWDAKQPGIFLFYWLAGRTFGFHAIGLHLFELLWHLALAVWMIRLLRPRLAFPALASAAPVLSIGGYYAVAGNWELTQAEMLAGLPLFACLAAATAGFRPATTRLTWLGSGVAAGVAVLFKLLFAPIPVAIWVVLALAARRAHGVTWRAILRDRLAPAALGTALVLGVTAGAFAVAGALGPLLWTAFVYPLEALAAGGGPSATRLISTARWWAEPFWPLIPLALVAIAPRRGAPGAPAFGGALAWCLAGAAVFLSQTMSWWRYQTFLLIVPVAMLAVRGCDRLALALPARFHGAAGAGAALMIAALAFAPALQVRLAGEPLLPPRLGSAAELTEWQRRSSPGFDRAWIDAAFLREPGTRPGAIYVFGDPRTIALSGRRQAIAVNGWSWESYSSRQWAALPAQLAAAAPAYVGIEPMYEPLLRERTPDLWNWLEANYRRVKSGKERSWYERTTPGPAVPAGN